jgi:hypothetical protein
MGYTLGQAARAVGMSKTSIFRSIKAGRISGTKDEFGQWCIEPCELHRVYPALTDVTDSHSTAEQAVTGAKRGVSPVSRNPYRFPCSNGGSAI